MRAYLVIYQQVRSWIRMRESGDGLRGEGVLAELGLIPAPALDAGAAPAAVALRRVNLHDRRRCHFRRRRPPPLWMAQAPLCDVPEPAAG